jgi:hypothetical protein
MLMVSGNPAIAYYRSDNGNLLYVRANDLNGAGWGAPVIVDSSTDDVGKFASMALIADSAGVSHPAIAYFNDTSNTVLYRRASDTTGASWGAAVTAINLNATSLSLRQVLGRVLVFAGTAGSVSFNHSTDDIGASWGTSTVIEADSTGSFMSASVMVNGLPVLSYYDSNQELHFAHPKLD